RAVGPNATPLARTTETISLGGRGGPLPAVASPPLTAVCHTLRRRDHRIAPARGARAARPGRAVGPDALPLAAAPLPAARRGRLRVGPRAARRARPLVPGPAARQRQDRAGLGAGQAAGAAG